MPRQSHMRTQQAQQEHQMVGPTYDERTCICATGSWVHLFKAGERAGIRIQASSFTATAWMSYQYRSSTYQRELTSKPSFTRAKDLSLWPWMLGRLSCVVLADVLVAL